MSQSNSATGVVQDRRGVAWTLMDEVLPLQEALVASWVGHRRDVRERLDALLAADDGAVLGLCARGFALALQGRRASRGAIEALVSRARTSIALRGATESELALVRSLERVAAGWPHEAAAVLDAHLERTPLDLFALKLAHALHFLIGDTERLAASVLRALPRWDPAAPGRAFVLGCAAFAHVERGALEAAERLGRQAIDTDPTDAWGRHAVGHALAAAGRRDEGIAWLAGGRDLLPTLGNFGGHLAWHEALLLTEAGRPEEALALHRAHVAPWLPADDYRDLSNGAVLVPRLRAALPAHDALLRSDAEALAARALARCGDHGSPFADVHAVLALAAVDLPAARRYVRSMTTGEADDWAGAVGRDVAVPIANAIVALAEGAPGHAAALLTSSAARWPRLGGSRIQRSVLDALLYEATRRAAVTEAAE